jgi:alpha-glucosidase
MHRVEGDEGEVRVAPHAEIHNVYGMQNVRATFEGLTRLRPDERPYVMTRAMFAGTQRYAVTWTGDNRASWEHLKLSLSMILSLGLSGVPYVGADVGGFAGAPSADLLTRWIEIGAFLPVFRDHYGKGSPAHEPWADGPAHLDIRRRFIEERYRLLPYWYALADEHARTGAPLVRPIAYEFEDAAAASCDQSSAFMVGPGMMVALAADLESPGHYDVCLPPGGWYDYWSGRAVGGTGPAGPVDVPQKFQLTPALDSLPIYVRAGTILPRQPLVQSTADRPDGPLSIDVYPGADCHGTIYLDDGHSLGYRRGEFLRQGIRCALDTEGLSVDFAPREGSFRPWWRGVRVTVHDVPGLRVAGTPLQDAGLRDRQRDVSIDIADPVEGAHVRLVRGATVEGKARL